MAKNTLPAHVNKQFVDITSIFNNPVAKNKLQTYIDEAVRCKQKILDENESIKGLREAAVEEIGIQPKMFNALVGTFFNNNFEEKREEHQQIVDAIDAILFASGE